MTESKGLRTERLLLRRWRADDLDPLAAIDGDPEEMRYIGNGSVRTREQTADMIARIERDWETVVPAHDRPVRVLAITRDEYESQP